MGERVDEWVGSKEERVDGVIDEEEWISGLVGGKVDGRGG